MFLAYVFYVLFSEKSQTRRARQRAPKRTGQRLKTMPSVCARFESFEHKQ